MHIFLFFIKNIKDAQGANDAAKTKFWPYSRLSDLRIDFQTRIRVLVRNLIESGSSFFVLFSGHFWRFSVVFGSPAIAITVFSTLPVRVAIRVWPRFLG